MKLSFLSFVSVAVGVADGNSLRTKITQSDVENSPASIKVDNEAADRNLAAERECDTADELKCRNKCYQEKGCRNKQNSETCKRACRNKCCSWKVQPKPATEPAREPANPKPNPTPRPTPAPVPAPKTAPVPAPKNPESVKKDDKPIVALGNFNDKRLELQCYRDYKWHSARKEYKHLPWYKPERCHPNGWCPTYRDCFEGADIRIRDCGQNRNKNKQYWDMRDGALCASQCPQYCVTMGRLDDGRKAAVLTKKKKEKLNWIESKRGYEIQREDKCFTMHHLPLNGEPMKFDSCYLARWTNSNNYEVRG